jgi:DNA uptake protein ComE-like DNA-binding protein
MRLRGENRGVLRWWRRERAVRREPGRDPWLADEIEAMIAREGERARRRRRPLRSLAPSRTLTEIQAAETQVADELRACATRLAATLESTLGQVDQDVGERMLSRYEARVVGARAAATVRPPPGATAPIELNTATVADLRQLMSLTQARRLIRCRERAGGFRSFEEVDLVPGLPAELRRDLRRSATIRS